VSAESIDFEGDEFLRLDVEPGPEVRVVRDADGDRWRRAEFGWTIGRWGGPLTTWAGGPAQYGPVRDVTREAGQ